MTLPIRHFAYAVALGCRVAGTTWLAPLLPQGGTGAAILISVVAVSTAGVAVLENKLICRRWLEPRTPLSFSSGTTRSLLRGHAPPPFSLGVVLGSLLAVRLL